MNGFLKLKTEVCSNQPSKEFYKIQPSSIVLQSDPGGKLVLQHPTQDIGVSALSLGRMYGRPAERTCSFLLLAFVNKHKHIPRERAEVLGESSLISENSMSMSIQNA